jgi:tRNA threonylcarbamoyl adenosine modification protein (Sua5/YciO/YrdC/YwlC family)
MIIKLYPENPDEKKIASVVDALNKDGLIIYPTDTVYGLGCNIFSQKAINRVARLKGVSLKKANFSIICSGLSHLSDYTKQIDNSVFKLLKNHLPGPYTFILPANNRVPKLFQSGKKTVGIRIPDNPIILEIVKQLGNPIMTTSVVDEDDIIEYTTDPELIHDRYKNVVDLVIDGGYGDNTPSTVIDCTKQPPEIIREGKGEIE